MDEITVMLVEDHLLVRQGTRDLLDKEPDLRVVAEAGDGIEAVQLAQEHQPDVILMDISLPRMNGLEATRRIKGICPTTAVLVLTAYDDEEYVIAFLKVGAAGYLMKDVSVQDLVVAVRAVHAGETVLHPAVAAKAVHRVAQEVVVIPKAESVESMQPTGLQLEILRMASQWMTNQEIARMLSISSYEVRANLNQLFQQLGVGSRIEAVLYALRKGWLPRR